MKNHRIVRWVSFLFVKALEDDAKAFSEIAKRFELLLVPSDPFDYPGYVRIAYCVKRKTIIDAIPAFKKLFECYSEKRD